MSMPRIGDKGYKENACYVEPQGRKDKKVDQANIKSGTMKQAYEHKIVPRKK